LNILQHQTLNKIFEKQGMYTAMYSWLKYPKFYKEYILHSDRSLSQLSYGK